MPVIEVEVFEGRQLAAARTLAGLTVRDLAALAKVNKATIVALEKRSAIEVTSRLRHGYTSGQLWERVTTALAEHGVVMVQETEDHGAGVRWTRPRAGRHTPQLHPGYPTRPSRM